MSADLKIETKEVSWKALDIDIYGTIVSPNDGKSHPGIVMIAGSGPTDRDWCSPLLPGKNGSAKLLAEALALKGYVTLRYDKMASGPHVMENLPKFTGKISMESHVEELAGAVKTLASQDNVDAKNLYVLTNSEGGIHAVNYQLQDFKIKFKGLILTGAPGRSIGSVGRSQFIAQIRSLPKADRIMTDFDEVISEFLNGKAMVIPDTIPESLTFVLKALETPANLPFSRELWSYDLAEYIVRIAEPVFIIIGKKDTQVDWSEDGKTLEQALKSHSNAKFSYPENANHVLKHEELPLEKLTPEYVGSRYNAPETVLDDETLNLIMGWLKDHSSGKA